MKVFRLAFWAGIASVLSALAIYAFIPEPVTVDTFTVTRGPMSVEVSAEGRSRVTEHFLVSAPVDGWLERIGERAGDPVRRGEVVARLYPASARLLDARGQAEAAAQVASARAALAFAEAVRQEAEAAAAEAGREADRTRRLFERDIVSISRLDQALVAEQQATARVSAARAGLRQAQAGLTAAEARLDPPEISGADAPVRELLAPTDGMILRVHVPSEGLVAAATPLLEIADPGKLEIIADFLSEDTARLRAGAAVRITQWGGETLTGCVRRIEPSGFTRLSALGVEQQRVGVIIDLENTATVGLGDGYRVRAHVTVWSGDDVVSIPASALFRDGPSWKVFVIVKGRARTATVLTGWKDTLNVQILSGLSAGDEVIVYPSGTLREGMKVRTRQKSAAAMLSSDLKEQERNKAGQKGCR